MGTFLMWSQGDIFIVVQQHHGLIVGHPTKLGHRTKHRFRTALILQRHHGLFTLAEGGHALQAALPEVGVLPFDLPHLRGSRVVLHLLSLLSPLDEDLVVAYLPLMPVRLVQLLLELGIQIVEVPDEEFETMGPNVLALAPRVGLALEGNDETRRRLERAGVEVDVYRGDEISRKGDGGPTCLTRPLLRG